jgi:hypothetical protein
MTTDEMTIIKAGEKRISATAMTFMIEAQSSYY